ncbi:radical SAM protein [Nocardia terpenica]|uniref:radical SAM protein n=1 Tax=Nocardia terpenica TaxID=455432 RepID=UPI0023B19C6F|nr:radical SAM protein [Nocardia terpenica]
MSGAGGARGILIASLASACGCDCVFCGLPDTKPHSVLPREVLITALERPPDGDRWEEVNITGGDPLVIPAARRLFPALLARRSRFEQLSVSSAGIPAKPALAGLAALDDGLPIDVYVSLDGVGEVHDRVRRRKGAFAQVSEFLREARCRDNLRIALTCVINRLNIDDLDELADYADAEGLPVSYAVVNKSDHYINSQPLFRDVSLRSEHIDQAVDFLTRRSGQRLDDDLQRVLYGRPRELPCRLLHNGVLVTSDGTMSICGTSKQMVLADALPAGDLPASWDLALARRPRLLESGVAQTCQTCTTNCFAWRNSDGPAPA